MFIQFIKRVLRFLKAWLPATRSAALLPVDAQWYLQNNPDVAAADLDPTQHFNRFGLAEGRLPMPAERLLVEPVYKDSVLVLELLIWRGYSHEAIPRLKHFKSDDINQCQRARLALAEWYFCQGQLELAESVLAAAYEHIPACKPGLQSAMVVASLRLHTANNNHVAYQQVLNEFADKLGANDRNFLMDDSADPYQRLNTAYERAGLQLVPKVKTFAGFALLEQEAVALGMESIDEPLISVIVPVFNAGEGLCVAVNSLLAQTHRNLEVILVDDASSDNSVEIAEQLATQDARVRVLTLAQNGGAYAARNAGVRVAKGAFITVHDSDDWSHPNKLERQLKALVANPQACYSISYWVRVLPDMRFIGSWLLSSPYLQLNHSSALFRREVIERCGLWDEVRVAGDTEYLRRVQALYSGQSEPVSVEVDSDLPLALSLVHPQSLTQSKATHVSSIFFGLRRIYRDGMALFHAQTKALERIGGKRPFAAPLGNLSKPATHAAKVLVADFSVWDKSLEMALAEPDGLVLLHWPADIARCEYPIHDNVWAYANRFELSFLHPGLQLTADNLVVLEGDLLHSRPDALPLIKLPADSAAIQIVKPATRGYVAASMFRILLEREGAILSAIELFDEAYYKRSNDDVRAASIDPFEHYIRYGRTEGRLPCELQALDIEQKLWASDEKAQKQHENELQALITNNPLAIDGAYAAWALTRFYYSMGDYQQVLVAYQAWQSNPAYILAPGHRGPWLVWFSCQLEEALRGALPDASLDATSSERKSIGLNTRSETLHSLNAQVQVELEQQGSCVDLLLASASLASVMHQPQRQLSCLAHLWRELDFSQLISNQVSSTAEQIARLTLDNISTVLPASNRAVADKSMPLVSVIIPCYNSARTLSTALESLLRQSWPELEVLMVDDASTDSSVAVAEFFIERFAEQGMRLEVIRQRINQGAYAARNAGLAAAKGAFITTHDADDWSHPQKIQRQAEALLKQKDRVASVSHWVRATDELVFGHWRPESSWVHRNVSSLMFRRKVHDELGFWDRVSVDADTEFYYRIVQAYGLRSVVEVCPGVPLAIGRHDSASLSQSSATHLRSQYHGLRFDYQQAARNWHQQAMKPTDLFMESVPAKRPFEAPLKMLRPAPEQIADEVFDADWYLAQYPDVKAAGVNPREHFIKWGMAEGRIPGPVLPAYQQVEFKGQGWQGDKVCIMVFAHQVSSNQFGAERSLLDVIKAIDANVVVVLPRDDATYRQAMLQYAQVVHIQPLTWWNGEREASPVLQDVCQALMQRYSPAMVYVNTLTLWEPLLAARAEGVESVVHVRELPDADPGLCAQLGATADQIRGHITVSADRFIANSQVVAEYLNEPARTQVVPNFIELEPFSALPTARVSLPLRVGMLSSNLAKKGVADVFALAKQMHQQGYGDKVRFYLYGPQTQVIKDEQVRDLSAMVETPGYVEQPGEALAELDVILNLSHFQESFGRSVLEAMAAGRPVLCYAWGALPELVTKNTGCTVEFKDTETLAQVLQSWVDDTTQLEILAMGAKVRAGEYQFDKVAVKLNRALGLIPNPDT